MDSSIPLVGNLAKQKHAVTDYYFLREINDSLLNENKALRQKLFQQDIGIPIKDSNGTTTYLKDTIKKEFRFKYYAAKVLNNTFDEANNYFTINKGYEDHVKRGMAVLSSTGIAGQIISVGNKYAVAKSILSDRFRISAQLKDGTLGYINWSEMDSRFVTLNDIGPTINVKQGDSVYTSGFSLFPPNIFIGRVAGIMPGSDANKYKIYLSTNFKRMHFVYVVEDISGVQISNLIDTAKVIDAPYNPKNKSN
jgi:rod shape-determining protein MreC